MNGVYVGPRWHLNGERALLRPEGKYVLAQFDNLKLPRHYTHNWKRFSRSQWRIEK